MMARRDRKLDAHNCMLKTPPRSERRAHSLCDRLVRMHGNKRAMHLLSKIMRRAVMSACARIVAQVHRCLKTNFQDTITART